MTTVDPTVSLRRVPGPSGSTLLGVLPDFNRDLFATFLSGFHRYGDIVAYRLGPPRGPHWLRRRVVTIHHPTTVHHVLTQAGNGTFTRTTDSFQVLTELIGDGLLTTDGDVWRRQRRTLQPLFTPRRVGTYAAMMTDEAERVMSGPEPTGEIIDLHATMQDYTLRVVGRALFGDDVSAFVPALQRLGPKLNGGVVARARRPWRLPLGVPTPANRTFTRLRAQQYALVREVVDARHRRIGDDAGDDLISCLRAARDPETGLPLSDAEIIDQAVVFLLAGHDTTAAALTFTLHQLGLDPALQDEVAAGDDALLRAAVLEGMRLFPPAHTQERLAATDTELGGYDITAGTIVLIPAYVNHRHPEFWPDPERFDPRRFLGEHDRPRYAYIPFGGGPRKCIGEHFAMLEAVVLLRAILSRYRIESLDARLPLAPLVTLHPSVPVRVRLTPRPA